MNNQSIKTKNAPEPVGAYPHAKRVGNLLFLSGVGPRKPGSKKMVVDFLNEGETFDEEKLLQSF